MSETISDIGEFGSHPEDTLDYRERGREGRKADGRHRRRCRLLPPHPGYELLVTCDSIVEGRHYLPRVIEGYDLGLRAMTANISDIGAMGGAPLYALVSLGLKGGTPVAEIEALYRGFLSGLNPFGACIIGGNVAEAAVPFIDITLIGEIEWAGRSAGAERDRETPSCLPAVPGGPQPDCASSSTHPATRGCTQTPSLGHISPLPTGRFSGARWLRRDTRRQ